MRASCGHCGRGSRAACRPAPGPRRWRSATSALSIGKHELGRHRVLVERHRDRAERLRREHRRVEPRPVLADRRPGARRAAGRRRRGRRRASRTSAASAHQRERLPDAELLLAQRRCVRAAPPRARAASRGKVVCTGGVARGLEGAVVARAAPTVGKTGSVTLGSIPAARAARACVRERSAQSLTYTVPVKLEIAVSPAPSSRTTSIR